MDHILELPADLTFELITIPHISSGIYDKQGFYDFPSLKGFAIFDLNVASYTVTQSPTFEAFSKVDCSSVLFRISRKAFTGHWTQCARMS